MVIMNLNGITFIDKTSTHSGLTNHRESGSCHGYDRFLMLLFYLTPGLFFQIMN